MNDEDLPRVEDVFDAPTLYTSDSSMEGMFRLSEAEINKQGWNQPPMVAILSANDIGAEVVAMGLPDEVLADFGNIFPLYIQEMVFLLAEIPAGGTLLPVFQDMVDEVLGHGLRGVIMSVEGWAVSRPDEALKDTDPDKYQRWYDAWENGDVEGFEGKREERVTWFMDMESNVHIIGRYRGGDEKPRYKFVSGVDWEFGTQGALMEATRNFIRILVTLMMWKGLFSEKIMAYWHADAMRTDPGTVILQEEALREASPAAYREYKKVIESQLQPPGDDD